MADFSNQFRFPVKELEDDRIKLVPFHVSVDRLDETATVLIEEHIDIGLESYTEADQRAVSRCRQLVPF
jgi:hypothetical protein